MKIDTDLVILVLFLIDAGLFVLFVNLQHHYVDKLKNVLRTKHQKIYEKLILFDSGFYGIFIPRPIRLLKYIWFERVYNKEVGTIIKRIRLAQFLALLFLLLPFIILAIVAFILEWVK